MISSNEKKRIDTMICSMARVIPNGHIMGEGIGTFIPNAAYMLAKLTTAPDSISLCPIGNAIVDKPRKLSLFLDEYHTIPNAIKFFDYIEVNTQLMPAWLRNDIKWCEFQRPAQIDSLGNTNNVLIGSYYNPKLKLPGAAGIPDEAGTFYYIPNHSKKVFVKKIDFKSGYIRKGGKIFTDLGIFKLNDQGQIEVISIHEGVDKKEIESKTDFEIIFNDYSITKKPTLKELKLLEEQIDPQGLRFLEVYSSRKRREILRELIQ